MLHGVFKPYVTGWQPASDARSPAEPRCRPLTEEAEAAYPPAARLKGRPDAQTGATGSRRRSQEALEISVSATGACVHEVHCHFNGLHQAGGVRDALARDLVGRTVIHGGSNEGQA